MRIKYSGRGNFTEACLTDGDSCAMEADQTRIFSSLLFSTDRQLFPEVGQELQLVIYSLQDERQWCNGKRTCLLQRQPRF